jgi:hypothetical protein
VSATASRITINRARSVGGSLLIRIVWVAVVSACALLVVRDESKAVAEIAAAVALAAAFRARAYGFLLGLALVVNLNGIPGFNANPANVSISHLQDAMVLVVLVACIYTIGARRLHRRTPLQRSLYVLSGLLALWWLITWFRTAVFDGVPASLSFKYARDYLYFALLLPVLTDIFVAYPRLIRQFFWTLGIAASVFAAAQIVRSQAHVSLDFILHPQLFTATQGTTRVYSPMTMLVRAAFALSLGCLIAGSSPRTRRRAILPAVLLGVSVLLQLTRAAYLGLAVGLVVAGAVWWFRRDLNVRSTVRAQLVLIPVVVLMVIGISAAISARERHLISVVSTRAVAGYTDVNTTGGTFATRVNDTNALIAVLGSRWPAGLGFLHPSARPFPSLPGHAIRNGDLGLLNAVMLMGVVGAILVYLPIFRVLGSLLTSAPPQGTERRSEWIRLGATIWVVGSVASSITLTEFASFGGFQISAFLLAVAASVCVHRRHGQPADADARLPGAPAG